MRKNWSQTQSHDLTFFKKVGHTPIILLLFKMKYNIKIMDLYQLDLY